MKKLEKSPKNDSYENDTNNKKKKFDLGRFIVYTFFIIVTLIVMGII